MYCGRKDELDLLEECCGKDENIIVSLYGFKGDGVTSLVDEFMKGKQDFLYLNAATVSCRDDLMSFFDTLSEKLNARIDSWTDAFRATVRHFNGKRFVLAIDGYDDLAASYEGIFDDIVSMYRNSECNALIILCGDNIPLMSDIERSYGFYSKEKLRIESICLKELDFHEALPLLDGIPNEDKLRYLTLFGCNPCFLKAIDKAKSFEDNVKSMFFSPSGICMNRPQTLMKHMQGNTDMYEKVLASIARGNLHPRDIMKDLHLSKDEMKELIRPLEDHLLVSANELILSSSITYLTITDPVLRFWYTIIYGKTESIRTDGDALFNESKEQIQEYLDRECEDVIVSYALDVYLTDHDKDFFDGIYRTTIPTRDRQELLECAWVPYIQHDMFVCISHAKEPLSNDMTRMIVRNFDCMAESNPVQFYIYSPSGYAPDMEKRNYIHLLTVDDMFNC